MTREEFVQSLIDSKLMSPAALQELIRGIPVAERPTTGVALARRLVRQGLLTRYQADAVFKRQFDRLSIGQYDVLEQIGSGGMGSVYKARHRRMKRIVAIKFVTRHLTDVSDIVKRFEREVQVISSLQHPNIVAAHDADECEAGPFLVMEYVPGHDLELIVQRSGLLSVAQAIDCILQAARGLAYAHSKNVIHRDIKPANLLRVNATGCIKITDLGLARLKDDQNRIDRGFQSLTETGNIIGTVLYMAPEQSVNSKITDHRCDIYSLGCTLYYLLHGKSPFEGESRVDTIMLHRKAPIPSLRDGRPEVPESLDSVFRRMVAKLPAERYQLMSDVADALQACSVDLEAMDQPPHSGAPITVFDETMTAEFPAVVSAAVERTVLLVEPSNAQSLLIRGFLESQGFDRVELRRTGDEALRALSTVSVDVVVSAMHLDDMTGLELAHQVGMLAPQKRIGFILISSSLDASEVRQKAGGANITLLAKPFSEQQLSDSLRKAVTPDVGPQ